MSCCIITPKFQWVTKTSVYFSLMYRVVVNYLGCVSYLLYSRTEAEVAALSFAWQRLKGNGGTTHSS